MGSSIAASLAGGSGGGNSSNSISSILNGPLGQALQQAMGPSQAQMQASAAGANTSDPNNMSATGVGSSNIVQSNMMPPTPGMSEVGVPPTISSAVGNIPPVTTGSFTPQSQYAAEGIYGDKRARQASVTKKPLINIL